MDCPRGKYQPRAGQVRCFGCVPCASKWLVRWGCGFGSIGHCTPCDRNGHHCAPTPSPWHAPVPTGAEPGTRARTAAAAPASVSRIVSAPKNASVLQAVGRAHSSIKGTTAGMRGAAPMPPVPVTSSIHLGPIVLLASAFLLCGFRGCLWILSNAETSVAGASEATLTGTAVSPVAAQQPEHTGGRHKFHPSEMTALARSIETTTQGSALWH